MKCDGALYSLSIEHVNFNLWKWDFDRLSLIDFSILSVKCSHLCIIYVKIFEKILSGGLEVSFSICFGCSKEPSNQDSSFEYPQHMFWLRNKKNNFQLRTLIWGPRNMKNKCVFVINHSRFTISTLKERLWCVQSPASPVYRMRLMTLAFGGKLNTTHLEKKYWPFSCHSLHYIREQSDQCS